MLNVMSNQCRDSNVLAEDQHLVALWDQFDDLVKGLGFGHER